MILKVTDFKSPYQITTNQYTSVHLANQITSTQTKILNDLLGVELANLFVSDLVNDIPVTQRFIDIFEPFQKKEGCFVLTSQGMKEMLLSFTYFYFIPEQKNRNTISGTVQNDNELALNGTDYSKLTWAYNNGIDTYKAIQYHITQNKYVYPEFLGISKKYTNGI